jgi:hypothetical protein
VLYLSIPYAGFPAANTAKHAIIEALREIESEGEKPSSTSGP